MKDAVQRCASVKYSHRLAMSASLFVIAGFIGLSSSAFGQAADPTLFVSNEGNLEGSLTSLRIEQDNSLTVTDFIVLGTRNSVSEPCPGCNPYTLDLTPDGRYLVAGHAASSSFPNHVSITRVHPDASLELIGLFQVPNTPLGVVWLDDDHFAVTSTSLTNSHNRVEVHRYNRDTETISLNSNDFTGGFTTWLAVDRENKLLYSQRTSPTSAVRAYQFNDSGQISFVEMFHTSPVYPLEIGVSPDGARLYGGGGISDGGNRVVGIDIDTATGTMSLMAGSPFTSPGASPKQVVVTDDGLHAIVGHGTDATVRTFVIDQETGALLPTGHFFDVGSQGTLGNVATKGDLVFATDNSTVFDGVMGVYSFTIDSHGQLIQNGPIVNTMGISPRAVVPWMPATCPGDLDGDGVVDGSDLLLLLAAWGKCPGCPEDLNNDGVVDGSDLLLLLASWGPCPGQR